MHQYFLILLLWAGARVPCFGQPEAGFELVTELDDVKVHVRPEAGEDLSIRVSTEAETTVADLRVILDDAAGYPLWVHRCEEAYLLPGATEEGFTYYSRINLPFPFSDREVVAAITQSVDPETGVFVRHIHSRPDAVPPTKGAQRIRIYDAVWTLAPLPDGLVAISCQVRTAAGAGLPAWIRKEIMTGGPAKTVGNLVRLVQAR